ncbi:thiamine-phosphate kinase [Stutzerimonas azotifigens]|uniref:Thiamine-monophosphate kinase n=1 Tax=Stutzerimonas azotifigens TaxID=291995 RepID=A0ABR5Z5V0_9GAMM|nr:thiamine-phosphate kinase [Stutzerimonas azotifigens]MBA1275575.1 thiamine-phosphate kinase [Stutzerimonas azotifigens]
MGEFELIRQYFAAAACARPGGEVLLGIGDDCALLALSAGEVLAVSTDTLVEAVHFPAACDPELLAQRALGVSTSDLAAMGATPIGFTLALTLPDAQPSWLEAFSRGLDAMAARCGMRLLGGDTTRGPLSLTLTVFGRLPCGAALTRSGARPGDLLCVGGPLGDAAGALALVLGQRQASPPVADALLARYWVPRPQLELGQALRGHASAALDISDGLLGDCGHIASASGVALRIESERIPLSAPLLQFLGHEQALAAALAGGDDYLLAFTLPPDQLSPLQAQGWPVHPIGTVEAGSGVRLVDKAGAPVAFANQGYRHFSS